MTHEWRNAGIGILVLVLLAGGMGLHYWYTNGKTAEAPEETGQVAGEADDSASIPDGTPVTKTIKLNETVRIAGTKITPTEVIEDSRCPKDVQCIRAGTVRVGAVVTPRGSPDTDQQPIMFELRVPMTVGLDQITLIEVSPAPAAGVTISPTDYVFTFTVVKGAGTEYIKG
ncbi:MAG: hypothetical protein WAZ27_04985 [Minisyncoccia bacterium]